MGEIDDAHEPINARLSGRCNYSNILKHGQDKPYLPDSAGSRSSNDPLFASWPDVLRLHDKMPTVSLSGADYVETVSIALAGHETIEGEEIENLGEKMPTVNEFHGTPRC